MLKKIYNHVMDYILVYYFITAVSATSIILNDLNFNYEFVQNGCVELPDDDLGFRNVETSYHAISKSDGIFGLSHTLFSRYNAEDYTVDKVFQFRAYIGSRTIIDGGSDGKYDGLVDKIYLTELRLQGTLTRERDYEKYKKEFDEADKELKEQKERFKKYL